MGVSRLPFVASCEMGAEAGHPAGAVACLAFAIDMIDLIGASWGAATAQAVHAEVALRIVREACNRGLRPCGIDSDRLVVRFEGVEPNALESLAAAIAAQVCAMPVTTGAGVIHFTLSVGAAMDDSPSLESEAAESLALAALLNVQRFGGGHVRAVAPGHGLVSWYQHAMGMMRRVRDAMDNDRISLVYQPVVDRDGGVFYHECLLRMVDDAGTLFSPDEFVPVLEQLGAVGWFDHFVFDCVVDQLGDDRDAVIGCNVSGQSIGCAEWVERVIGRLSGRPDIAYRLIIEITETAAIFDLARTAKHVARLRALGVRVALDDFGAGYASFAHLRALGIDIVKLDKSFLKTPYAAGARAEECIGHLAELLRGLGLSYIVVEGVEDVESESWRLLRDHPDISHFQGYGFGVPGTYRAWRFSGS